MSYTNWNTGEPNDTGYSIYQSQSGEWCMEVHASYFNYTWNDVNCLAMTQRFVTCEASPVGLSTGTVKSLLCIEILETEVHFEV